MGGVAVSGNHLPNPLPPRVRRHSSTAQTRAKRARRFTEHARDRPVWQCRLCRTPTSQEPGGHDRRPVGRRAPVRPARRTAASPRTDGFTAGFCLVAADSPSVGRRSVVGLRSIRRRVGADPSSGCRRVAVGPSFGLSPDCRRSVVRAVAGPSSGVRPLGTDLRAARRTGRRYRVRTRPAPPVRNPPHSRRVRTPPDRHPDTPNGTAHPLRTGRGGRMEAAAPLGRAPVERMISAHATVCFQPTSFPSQSLAEMADQPPCQQAEGDRAVRFHPTGTGHERQAHFPARLTSETLRDRMLPARLPCRHKAGW